MTPAGKEHDERKSEIISVAEEMFSENGYDDTSVAMIIDRIGIAKGTFYHYFSSKDELLQYIVDALVEEVGRNAREIAYSEGPNALQKMGQLSMMFRTIGRGRERITDFLHEDRNAHWHLKLEKKLLPSFYDHYQHIIEQGIEEGFFDVKYPRETAVALLGATNALSEGKHDHAGRRPVDRKYFLSTLYIAERMLGMEEGSLFEHYKDMLEVNE